MRLLALIGFFIVTNLALAQQSVPDNRAVRVAQAWLSAFNSGDVERFKAFDATYPSKSPMVQMGGFRRQTGGFDLARIEKSDATTISGLFKEKASDSVARFELTLSADDPPKILNMQIGLVPTPADLAPARLSQADALAALTARVDAATRDDKFSGAVLVAKNDKVLLEKAWGLADRENKLPATLDTQFRMGSMNKMFTAVAILQLVDAGKLSLADTIGKHLPDYPNKYISTKVTVHHLLTHTGGTGDIFGPDYDKNRLTLKTNTDYVTLYGARAPKYDPGATWEYSNYGFVLLGVMIEKVSRMSYYDYVEKKVFAPAGMTATASLPESEPVAKRAAGYLLREDKWVLNTDTLPWRGTATGGGYSTVSDLLRFAEALQAGKLVSKATLREATSVQRAGYGFGFFLRGEGKWKGYGHGGGAPGMNGNLLIIPEQGYVLIALSNLDPPAATREVEFIAARLPEGL